MPSLKISHLTNKYATAILLAFLLLSIPTRVLATRCAVDSPIYVATYQNGQYLNGFKIEQKFANAITVCASKRVISDINIEEIDTINSNKLTQSIADLDELYEFEFPYGCVNDPDACTNKISSNFLGEDVDINFFREKIGKEILLERVGFFIFESSALFIRLIP